MQAITDFFRQIWTGASAIVRALIVGVGIIAGVFLVTAVMTGGVWTLIQFFLGVIMLGLAYVLTGYVAPAMPGGLAKGMVNLMATLCALYALSIPVESLFMTFRPVRTAVGILGPHVRLEAERQLVRSKRVDILAQNEQTGQIGRIVRPAEVYQRDVTETEVVPTGITLQEGTLVFIDRSQKCPPAYGSISPRGCVAIITRSEDGNLGSTRGFVDARNIVWLGPEPLPGLDRGGNLLKPLPEKEVREECLDLKPGETTKSYTWYSKGVEKQTIYMHQSPSSMRVERCTTARCSPEGSRPLPNPDEPFWYRAPDGQKGRVCVTIARTYLPPG